MDTSRSLPYNCSGWSRSAWFVRKTETAKFEYSFADAHDTISQHNGAESSYDIGGVDGSSGGCGE